jgi:predicted nucleic acid-binding protein
MAVTPELDALAQVFSLHTGEWEALRVALEHRPGLLLTDDTAARLAAGNLRIGTHGTIGILVRAIRRRQRTKGEILAALRSIPTRSTLHLKRSLLESVISEVESNS